ncbi:uncharacterized protein LOC119168283 isoform X2 [Rhipicephalus microplus]|uniref:uncharacterized protein LOC119168283 isoform X2 n=1 Tax=Rhipicephalus microplus TaxID=6941 RepID=UPI003F6BD5A0
MNGAALQTHEPGGSAPGMELVQRALSLYRRRHFTECAELCEQEPSSKQLQWLGMLALTQHAWLDELELEGLQSLAEELLDNQATAQTGRPGTSLRAPPPPTGGGRPMTREGRPLTGLRRRPRSRTATQQGVERALYTAGGRTARPTTAAPAAVPEFGRLGAAASGWPDKPWLSKPLFRFLYHQRGDVRQALELASQERSTDCCGWWSLQRGRCLLRLGMLREAEHQFRKAAEAGDPQPRTFLWLAKVYVWTRPHMRSFVHGSAADGSATRSCGSIQAWFGQVSERSLSAGTHGTCLRGPPRSAALGQALPGAAVTGRSERGGYRLRCDASLLRRPARDGSQILQAPSAAGHADGRAVQQPGAVLLLRAAVRYGARLLRPGAGSGRRSESRRRLVQPGTRRTELRRQDAGDSRLPAGTGLRQLPRGIVQQPRGPRAHQRQRRPGCRLFRYGWRNGSGTVRGSL